MMPTCLSTLSYQRFDITLSHVISSPYHHPSRHTSISNSTLPDVKSLSFEAASPRLPLPLRCVINMYQS